MLVRERQEVQALPRRGGLAMSAVEGLPGSVTESPAHVPIFEAAQSQLTPHEPPALTHLRRAVAAGAPWQQALVEAVGMWTAPSEVVDGVVVTYLIAGEAFDWLQLAERLLRELPDGHGAAERERLLFRGGLPLGVSESAFKDALGLDKYRAHLNFVYGVVVEEALWLAVEEEALKERGVRGLSNPEGIHDAVMGRLYRANHATLVRRFQKELGLSASVKFSLAEWKAFTYWLFRLRLSRSDSSRIASDTRKGLRMLGQLRNGPDDALPTGLAPIANGIEVSSL